MKEFDRDSLSAFNGKDENKTYIAHEGSVYDVSESKLWKGGVHMGRHHAGNDLTSDFSAAPHGTEVLERYEKIGSLKKDVQPSRPMPTFLASLLGKIPFLKRHPHPMLVHFPIVFSITPGLFALLYLITGVKAFETTSFHLVGAAVLFTPLAVITGFFTWWLNYLSKASRPVTIKIVFSIALYGVHILCFVWRLINPELLKFVNVAGVLYLLLLLSMIPLVSIVGWFGASMTFPIENE